MSNVTTIDTAGAAHQDGHPAHDPHLAHHFETPEQQYQSGKLGMWMFLATEILMFGGLFCAYAVYRHNHPEVFAEAHKALDRKLGAINTIVLITSSLTMAWGVRCAQLNQQKALLFLLIMTLFGGAGFMCIKAIEYRTKWVHHLGPGTENQFYKFPTNHEAHDKYEAEHNGGHEAIPHAGGPIEAGTPMPATGPATTPSAAPAKAQDYAGGVADSSSSARPAPTAEQAAAHGVTASPDAHVGPGQPIAVAQNSASGVVHDPNVGTTDEAKIKPPTNTPGGLNPTFLALHPQAIAEVPEHEINAERLEKRDQSRLATFFNIYFLMTGLHGLHVVVGMALIFWILMRAATRQQAAVIGPCGILLVGAYFIYLGLLVSDWGAPWHSWTFWEGVGIVLAGGALLFRGMMNTLRLPNTGAEFDGSYFNPVDLVGLYWHLVDLIWIFLFPLLYLIH
jgi:cytochrome c oxidase subunit 3